MEMKLPGRWLLLTAGTIIAALGMCLLDRVGQGQVMMAVLWEGMSLKLPITMGEACYLTSVVMLAFSFFYDRSQIRIGTVVHFLLYGWAVDAILPVLPRVEGSPALLVLYAALGILTLAVGIGVYAYADLGRGPYEGISFALCEKKGWQMKYVRVGCDGAAIAVGILLGGSVGVMTIVNLFLCGYLIQITTKALEGRIPKASKVAAASAAGQDLLLEPEAAQLPLYPVASE